MFVWVKFKNLLKNNPFWIVTPFSAILLSFFSPLGGVAILFSAFGAGFIANFIILRFTQPNLQGKAWELEKAKMEKEFVPSEIKMKPKTLHYNLGRSHYNGFPTYDYE